MRINLQAGVLKDLNKSALILQDVAKLVNRARCLPSRQQAFVQVCLRLSLSSLFCVKNTHYMRSKNQRHLSKR